MQDLFELTPELLLEQSQEMFNLCSAYENLFGNITTDLNGINGSWSDLLSNNFSAKIAGAQKTFSGALNMLHNSANSTRTVAQTAQEIDNNWASKIGGRVFNPDMISSLLSPYISDIKGDVAKGHEAIWGLRERLKDKLSSSQEALLKKIEKEVGKELFGGDPVKVLQITEKILEGDYWEAFQDGSKLLYGEVVKKAVEEMIGKQSGFINEGDVAQYAINLGWGTGTAAAEFVLDPSLKNAGNIAWNLTVQPVLDTAGDKIESVIKLIPGISEYYYDEHGAEDIGDAAGIALGDFYSLFSADEGIKEYGANYYKDGIWEGLWGGFVDIGSYIKDSGGIGNAASAFADTAWKDTQSNWAAFLDNMSYLFNAQTPKAVNVPLSSTNL